MALRENSLVLYCCILNRLKGMSTQDPVASGKFVCVCGGGATTSGGHLG